MSDAQFRQSETDKTYDLARKHMKGFHTALDIGCDVFQFAAKLEQDFDHVHCFDFRDKSNQMTKFIKNKNKITFHHTGLGEKEETKFTKPGVGRIKSDTMHGSSTLRVPVVPLDSFGLDENIDFIKMDVEGYEPLVIKGATKTIEHNNPVILCEINRGDMLAKKLLEGMGYRCVDIYYKLGQPNDYLFIR